MEKRGMPTVMICTDEFHQLGRHEAESLGMPALPIALVPHPLGGQQPEHIQEKADKVLEQVVRMLTTPVPRLMQQMLGSP
jgi:hypothetical protein